MSSAVTTHRRYIFEDPGAWEQGHDTALDTLRHACETFSWFNEPMVQGQEDKKLTFAFTVSGRDQWYVHKRAMELAVRVYARLGKRRAEIPVPIWEALAPHTNRGRYRLPRDG